MQLLLALVKDVFGSWFNLVGGGAFAATLIMMWLTQRLKKGFAEELEKIRLANAKALERFKEEKERRERCAMIADLFAEWAEGDKADWKLLNKLTIEANLWLPKDLVLQMTAVLNHHPDAGFLNLLIEVRKVIQGQQEGLVPNNFIGLWPGSKSAPSPGGGRQQSI